MKFIKKKLDIQASLVKKFSEEFDITPVIMEQIIDRGNDTREKIIEFLNPSEKSYHNPFLLKGMKECCERIKIAIRDQEKILVFGDYDVDGINATVIMLKTLEILGTKAKFYLPNRYIDGYGLTIDVIDKIKLKYNPDIIITVDCGISCHKEVQYAKQNGIEVIVTDHHEIPEILPEGIVLNAKRTDQEYPFKDLCGTGLAYKISQALIGKKAEQFLPIACIATISDIVPLLDENRAIVAHGLKKFNLLPIGLKQMLNVLKININKCSVSDISFKLAPKLNASGRMGDAKDSLYLYFCEDPERINILINKILTHNINRQNLCCLVERDCEILLTSLNLSKLPCIILSSKGWDQGILGIVCSKLVSHYKRPTFLFSEINGQLKGAGRSIPEINIHKLLSSMPDILETFGGHPVAAGLTLKSENYSTFIKKANEYMLKNHPEEIFPLKEEYDIQVFKNQITVKFIKDVHKLEPCGCGNIAPRLYIKSKDFKVNPLKRFINHCNVRIYNKVNLIYFNYLNDYNKLKKANQIEVIFEIQTDRPSAFKGIIRATNIDLKNLSPFVQNFVIPEFEQLKYLEIKTPSSFSYFDNNLTENLLKLDDYYGTAFVVNSEKSFNFIKHKLDFEKIGAIDLYGGCENSGINAVFICPSALGFVQSYKKIVFLDNIMHISYIAKINQLSEAKVFVNNSALKRSVFNKINNSRDNFAKIYIDIQKNAGEYITLRDLYDRLLKQKRLFYSYADFYCAFLVFIELNLISFNRINGVYFLKINEDMKSQLSESNIYRAVNEIKFSLKSQMIFTPKKKIETA